MAQEVADPRRYRVEDGWTGDRVRDETDVVKQLWEDIDRAHASYMAQLRWVPIMWDKQRTAMDERQVSECSDGSENRLNTETSKLRQRKCDYSSIFFKNTKIKWWGRKRFTRSRSILLALAELVVILCARESS